MHVDLLTELQVRSLVDGLERRSRRNLIALVSTVCLGLGLAGLVAWATPPAPETASRTDLITYLQDAPIEDLVATSAWISYQARVLPDPRLALLLDRLAQHALQSAPADMEQWAPVILPGLDAMGLVHLRARVDSFLSPSSEVELAVVPASRPDSRAPATVFVDGNSVEPAMLGDFSGRTQVVISRSRLGGLATKEIKRIVFRRDTGRNESYPQGMAGGWKQLHIRASWTKRAPSSLSPVFAKNHVGEPLTVFSGPYRVVDSPQLPAGTRVASLAPGVSAHIVLTTPIPPSASGNLCLDFVYERHATRSGPGTWLADAHEVERDTSARFGRSCYRPGRKDVVANGLPPSVFCGSTLRCVTIGPASPLALFVLGASNRAWKGLRLPFDLEVFGAKGCYLYVSHDVVIPTRLAAQRQFPDSFGVVKMEVPAVLGIAGARIHTQWLFFQPGANPQSLTATNAASVVLDLAPGLGGVGMVKTSQPAAVWGDVVVNYAPVICLSAQ